MLLLHLVSRAEETMPLFVSSFKHFHGPLPAGPHQWPAQAETGKVRQVVTLPVYSQAQFGFRGVDEPWSSQECSTFSWHLCCWAQWAILAP